MPPVTKVNVPSNVRAARACFKRVGLLASVSNAKSVSVFSTYSDFFLSRAPRIPLFTGSFRIVVNYSRRNFIALRRGTCRANIPALNTITLSREK